MNSGPVVRELFSREDRLRKRREFEECYASGVRVSGRHLQFFAKQRPGEGEARLGISVPRRAGKAVERNRLRRRVRELFRRNRSALAPGSIDRVFQCRPGATRATFSELLADYLETAGRLRSRAARQR